MTEKGTYKRAYLLSDSEIALIVSALFEIKGKCGSREECEALLANFAQQQVEGVGYGEVQWNSYEEAVAADLPPTVDVWHVQFGVKGCAAGWYWQDKPSAFIHGPYDTRELACANATAELAQRRANHVER